MSLDLERQTDEQLLSTIGRAQAILNQRQRDHRQAHRRFMEAAERASNPTELERIRLKQIVNRRFGSSHEKPCLIKTVTTCTLWECQVADRCRKAPGRDAALAILKQEDDHGR